MKFIKIIVKKILSWFGYSIHKSKGSVIIPNFGIDLLLDLEKLRKNPKFNIHLLNQSASVIFDIGANIGQTALKFSEHFADAQIFSFEPVGDTFKQFKNNIQGKQNIRAINKGLGSEVGYKEIYIYDISVLASMIPETPMMSSTGSLKMEMIEIDTIDNFCQNNEIGYIDLLKIDTEGYDLEVIKGAGKFLQKKAINFIYFEFFYVGNDTKENTGGRLIELHEYLNHFGYRPVTFYTDGIHTEHTGGFYNALYMRWDSELKI